MARGVKPLQRGRQERKTMHDGDYHRVLKAIQRARAIMKSAGRNHLDVRCPICGVFNAMLVVREGQNTGTTIAAMCTRGCFTAWE